MINTICQLCAALFRSNNTNDRTRNNTNYTTRNNTNYTTIIPEIPQELSEGRPTRPLVNQSIANIQSFLEANLRGRFKS